MIRRYSDVAYYKLTISFGNNSKHLLLLDAMNYVRIAVT